MKSRSLFLIILAAAIGGGVSSFAKIATQEIPPLSFTLLRFLLAGLVVVPVFWSRREKISFKSLRRLVLISLLATANVTLFIFGVQRTTAGISGMLYAAVPLLVGFFSHLFLQEKITRRTFLGILTGFVGVLLIIFLPLWGSSSVWNGDILGNLIILVATCSFAIYCVLSKKFEENYSPVTFTTVFVVVTIVIETILLPIELTSNANWMQHISGEALFALLYMGILGTGLYYLVYQLAIKRATPVIASMILYLQPVFTVIWAYFLLQEQLTWGFIAGALLCFVGVYTVTMKEKKQKTIAEIPNG